MKGWNLIMDGIVVFNLANVGSKSEGLRPFLYQGKGNFQPIWLMDDFSLGGIELIPFDGKKVSVEGEIDENDIFLIKSIKENND